MTQFDNYICWLKKEIARLKEDNTRAYSSLALAAEDEAGYQQVEMELQDEIEELKRQLSHQQQAWDKIDRRMRDRRLPGMLQKQAS